MAEERAIQAGQAAKRHDPLDGDAIMDATARLLAPRRDAASAQNRPAERPKRRQGDSNPPRQKKGQERQESGQRRQDGRGKPAPNRTRGEQKASPSPRPERRGQEGKSRPANSTRSPGRGRGPIEPTLRPSTQKDSTEHESLMRPYYLNDDE